MTSHNFTIYKCLCDHDNNRSVHDLFHSYQKRQLQKKYQQQRVIPYIRKELNQHQIGAVFKKCVYNWKG